MLSFRIFWIFVTEAAEFSPLHLAGLTYAAGGVETVRECGRMIAEIGLWSTVTCCSWRSDFIVSDACQFHDRFLETNL